MAFPGSTKLALLALLVLFCLAIAPSAAVAQGTGPGFAMTGTELMKFYARLKGQPVARNREAAAEAFRTAHGGKLVRFDDISEDYVLGPVELGEQAEAPEVSHSGH